MTPPVLLCIYNRLECTKRVVEAMRVVQPPRIFIAADGPRGDEDEARCAQVRAAALNAIDWSCEVTCDFSTVNMGVRRRIISAIDWVLSQSDSAIILEDDCLPHPDFFGFCTDLLERYANDERVMMITGTNPLLRWRNTADPASYHFTRWSMTWGWATWRRAWRHFDDDMRVLDDPSVMARIAALADADTFQRQMSHWQRMKAGAQDTWDYQWSLACLAQDGVAVCPATNLITNIGFDTHSTHTRNPLAVAAHLPQIELEMPLVHPRAVMPDRDYEAIMLRWLAGKPDEVMVEQHARHAMANGRALRAVLMLRAFFAAQRGSSQNPALTVLHDLALAHLKEAQ
jgi:hypothetical protein